MLHVMYLNKEGTFFSYFCEMNTLFKALSVDTNQCTVGENKREHPFHINLQMISEENENSH